MYLQKHQLYLLEKQQIIKTMVSSY